MVLCMSSAESFSNLKSVYNYSLSNWQEAYRNRTSQLSVNVNGRNKICDQHGRQLLHFCTTSYLGLDYEPSIQKGAIDAILEQGTLRIACSRNRCRLALLDEYQEALSAHFLTPSMVTLSCSSASSAMLPLIASGALNNGEKPVMVFDRFAHYSLNQLKALCATETRVMTIGHNDLDELESVCKKHSQIIYIADSFYSMGGISPLKDIVRLQNQYGMGFFCDDSHAMSAVGNQGTGYARSFFSDLPHNTYIVSSLAKAFGASGGIILYGQKSYSRFIEQYGGPINWSQSLNVAGLGAGMASLSIHRTDRLTQLQHRLVKNLSLFDQLMNIGGPVSPSPIRLIRCRDAEQCLQLSSVLADEGFLTSPVFFPVVPRNEPAIRITLRADMTEKQILAFCRSLNSLLVQVGSSYGYTAHF
ncbi:2-amino-3-ketobutyrate coenzyme A ligase [Serratia fonticola]|nr:2-amino-3-ketobutyrate coenzyme A ligase [Serratia fonticola]